MAKDDNKDENGFSVYPKWLWEDDAKDAKGKKINKPIIDPETNQQVLAQNKEEEDKWRGKKSWANKPA